MKNPYLELLKNIKDPIFFICNDPLWAVGLENILPNFHIICIDYKEIVDILKQRGINVFCLEKKLNKKNILFRSSIKLLQHPLVEKYIKKVARKDQKIHILPFKPSASISKYCQKKNYITLSANYELNLLFEDKLYFPKFLDENNFPVSPYLILPINNQDFPNLSKSFNLPGVPMTNSGRLFKLSICRPIAAPPIIKAE